MRTTKNSAAVDAKVVERGFAACRCCRLSPLCQLASEHGTSGSIVCRGRRLRRGEVLFREGDAFEALFAVCSGSIKTVAHDARAASQAIGFFIPGELVGISGLTARRHTSDAIALEATEITEIPFGTVSEAMDSMPALRRIVFQILAEQLAHDELLLLPLVGKKSATERLASYLLALGQRYAARGFSSTEFPLSMSRNDLSNHLGLAKETVCRLLARLSEEGLLSLASRRVRIHDLARLTELAGQRYAA